MVFYFGAERHNSRDFPRQKCCRPGVFRQGEELRSKYSHGAQWIFPRHLYAGYIFLVNVVRFDELLLRYFLLGIYYFYFSTLTGLWEVKASRERLFRFKIWWRERSAVLVKFEKFYVVAAHWEAALSTVFAGKILRQTTRTSARNNTVSETGEILM